MQSSNLARRGWILLFIGIATFYLFGLGAFPLAGPDEPRYVEVAREMLSRHDLITPTLGGLPWFEKPPLLYWLIIASFRVLGVSEYAARLGPAACALLCAVGVFWISNRVADHQARLAGKSEWNDSFPVLSALVFLSSGGVVVFARGATFDIVVTMTLTVALACFFVSEIASASSSDYTFPFLLGFFFFVGLSLLAKGLVGIVIPFSVIGAYFVMRRTWPGRKLLISLIWGIPLSALVAGLWYGPMISRHGWIFLDQFFIQHHFQRFISQKFHHPQPFYFYLLILPLLVLPWTVFLVSSLIGTRHWNWRGESARDRVRVFALAWIAAPLIFFSLSQSKLPAYILPTLPAVALLIGDRLTSSPPSAGDRHAARITGALAVLVPIGGALYVTRQMGIAPFVSGICVLPPVLVGLVLLFRPRPRGGSFALIAGGTLVSCALAIELAAPAVANHYTVRNLIEKANARGYGSAPVVQLHDIERTAEFYAAGRISYDARGEPIKLESVTEVAEAAKRAQSPILVIVPKKYERQLSQSPLLQSEPIADNGAVILFLVRSSKP